MTNTSSWDHTVSYAISTITGYMSDNPLTWLIEQAKNLPIDDQKTIDSHILNPVEIAQGGIEMCKNYHVRVLRSTSDWASSIGNRVTWLSNRVLCPLSFCEIGRTLRHSISHDILGSVAQTIAFCALQIFHLMPYGLTRTIILGSIQLYQANPYSLAALLSGTMLSAQLWLIYVLIKTVEISNRKFEQKADEFITAIDLVKIAKNTMWSSYNMLARTIRFGATEIQKRPKTTIVLVGTAMTFAYHRWLS